MGCSGALVSDGDTLVTIEARPSLFDRPVMKPGVSYFAFQFDSYFDSICPNGLYVR